MCDGEIDEGLRGLRGLLLSRAKIFNNILFFFFVNFFNLFFFFLFFFFFFGKYKCMCM